MGCSGDLRCPRSRSSAADNLAATHHLQLSAVSTFYAATAGTSLGGANGAARAAAEQLLPLPPHIRISSDAAAAARDYPKSGGPTPRPGESVLLHVDADYLLTEIARSPHLPGTLLWGLDGDRLSAENGQQFRDYRLTMLLSAQRRHAATLLTLDLSDRLMWFPACDNRIRDSADLAQAWSHTQVYGVPTIAMPDAETLEARTEPAHRDYPYSHTVKVAEVVEWDIEIACEKANCGDPGAVHAGRILFQQEKLAFVLAMFDQRADINDERLAASGHRI